MKLSTILIAGVALLVVGYLFTSAPASASPAAVVPTAGPANAGLAFAAALTGGLVNGPAPVHGVIPGGTYK